MLQARMHVTSKSAHPRQLLPSRVSCAELHAETGTHHFIEEGGSALSAIHAIKVGGHEGAGAALRALLAQALNLAAGINLQVHNMHVEVNLYFNKLQCRIAHIAAGQQALHCKCAQAGIWLHSTLHTL